MESTAKAKSENHSLKIYDVLKEEVFKEADLSDLFGTLKTKISGQIFKDMAREGWGK